MYEIGMNVRHWLKPLIVKFLNSLFFSVFIKVVSLGRQAGRQAGPVSENFLWLMTAPLWLVMVPLANASTSQASECTFLGNVGTPLVGSNLALA